MTGADAPASAFGGRCVWACSSPVLEAPLLVAGLDDIAVVRQPVEHGGRRLRVAEDLRAVGEGEVRGDDDARRRRRSLDRRQGSELRRRGRARGSRYWA